MTNETSRLLGDIVHFASPILELVERARQLSPSSTATLLEVEQAKLAVYGFLAKQASIDELTGWARFLLGRRDVAFAPGHEAQLLELLEDISFSDEVEPFGFTEAEAWVTRLDMSY